jgi:hypothetical protein
MQRMTDTYFWHGFVFSEWSNVTFLHYFAFDPLDPLLHFRHCVNRYGTPDALYGIRVPLIDPTASAATVPVPRQYIILEFPLFQ